MGYEPIELPLLYPAMLPVYARGRETPIGSTTPPVMGHIIHLCTSSRCISGERCSRGYDPAYVGDNRWKDGICTHIVLTHNQVLYC